MEVCFSRFRFHTLQIYFVSSFIFIFSVPEKEAKAETRQKSPPPKVAKMERKKSEDHPPTKRPTPSEEKEEVQPKTDKITPKRSDSHEGTRRSSSHGSSSAKRKSDDEDVVDRTPLAEQKRSNYLNYLHRGGPPHPGTKTIPEVKKHNFLLSKILS